MRLKLVGVMRINPIYYDSYRISFDFQFFKVHFLCSSVDFVQYWQQWRLSLGRRWYFYARGCNTKVSRFSIMVSATLHKSLQSKFSLSKKNKYVYVHISRLGQHNIGPLPIAKNKCCSQAHLTTRRKLYDYSCCKFPKY